MGLQRVQLLAATALAACVTAPVGNASTELRPPVTWLKGEGNFTKAHRSPESLESIVVHVTEGAFWGSVQWLKSPRAHASSHFIVSRGGKIIQLVHVSDIAWHAGNWNVNRRSVGIEHEGFTYGPAGFTDAQYGVRLSVVTRLRPGPLAGIVPWRAKTTGGVRSVEFVLDGRVVWTDRRAPFTFAGGHGLNTTRLGNGAHVLELRAYGDGTRHDVTSRTVVVDNRAFRLTTAGAREWTRVRGTVRLRVHAWGAEAKRVVFRVDGRAVAADSRAPYVFTWDSRRVRDRKHVLELHARSVDGRVATRRIALVVRNRLLRPRPAPKPTPKPKPKPAPTIPPLAILGQSVTEGETFTGLVLWRVFVQGRAERVEFLIDGVSRGVDLAAPYTLGWDASDETPGSHTLTARAQGKAGKVVTAGVSVTVSAPQEPADTPTP